MIRDINLQGAHADRDINVVDGTQNNAGRDINFFTPDQLKTLKIDDTTPRADVDKAAKSAINALDQVPALPAATRKAASDALTEVTTAGPATDKPGLKAKLDNAADGIKSLGNLAETAMTVVKVLVSIGGWVVAAL